MRYPTWMLDQMEPDAAEADLDDEQWDWAMAGLAREQERIRQLLWDQTEPYLVRIREARPCQV